MMFILYDLIFLIFAIIYLPYFLLKRKLHAGFIQRLGFLPPNLKFDKPFWIHAVSVGEARIAEILVKQLRRAYPQKRFVLSSVTATGNKILQGFQSEGDFVFYLPLDLSFVVKKVVRRIQPCACIIMETEIWPNLITRLNKMNLPVILLNARISDRSFLGYCLIKPLIKPILNKINFFCVRSSRDAQRLSSLGVASDKLKVTGNMKYDITDYMDFNKDYTGYRLRLGLNQGERLFVAGSTHPGEEEILLGVYKRLINEFPGLRLLIAPRHPERSSEIEALIHKFGFKAARLSGLNRQSGAQEIFLLDTVGQLMFFYAVADIVFMGGSLIKKGGHNILEPAYFSKPIIFGSYMFNFHDISDLFLREGAASMVGTGGELLKEISFLLNNPSRLKDMGNKARQLVLENQGVTKRNVQTISLFISHG